MKRILVLGTVIATALLAITVEGQQPPNPADRFGPIRAPEKLADNLYLVGGVGGNSTVFVRSDGVLLVDTKLPGQGQALLDEIKKVTDKPITHIINTHAHQDHTGSNAFFPANVEIIAQENAKTNMEKYPLFQSEQGKVGLPDRSYKDRMTLFSGKDAVDLYYFGPAHTNNDTFVVFRAARMMHGGDAFAVTGVVPLIDVNSGGSGLVYGETLEKAAAGIQNVDRVITGHGDVMSSNPKDNIQPWQSFVDYGEFNRLFVAHARASLAAGKSAEQALAEFKLKLPEKFKNYELAPPLPPGFPTPPGRNFALIYKELGK